MIRRALFVSLLSILLVMFAFSSIEIASRWWQIDNTYDTMAITRAREWYTDKFTQEQQQFKADVYPDVDGSLDMQDMQGVYFNVKDGLRVTANQPLRYKHTLWMFGNSTLAGYAVPDQFTIASYLQQLTSNRVVNLARAGSTIFAAENQLASIDLQSGDTVIYLYGYVETMTPYFNAREDTYCSQMEVYWHTSFCEIVTSQLYIAPKLLDSVWFEQELNTLRSHVRATLARARAFVLAHGATFVFVLQPSLRISQVNERVVILNRSLLYSVVYSWYILQEVADCDLTNFYMNQLDVFIDDVHLTDTGNKLMAYKIRECINSIL